MVTGHSTVTHVEQEERDHHRYSHRNNSEMAIITVTVDEMSVKAGELSSRRTVS